MGSGAQQSIMVPQTIFTGKEIALGTSAMIFMQTMSGTILVAVAQSVFQQDLVSNLSNVPGIDPQVVVNSGANDLKTHMDKLYRPDQVQSILEAYAIALQKVFLMALILCALSLLGAGTLEWRSTKKLKKAQGDAETGTKSTECGKSDTNIATTPTSKT